MNSEKNDNGGESGWSRFETVVAEYETALLRYATRLVRDPSAAQDIVQNTFVKLFVSAKPEEHSAPELSAWLYRVTHNGAVDHIRRQARYNACLTRHAQEEAILPAEHSPGFDEDDRAEKLLATLSLRERQLVILKVYEEKSYREIARITRLSESNVGYILHFAMKKMAAAHAAAQQRGNGE